MSSVPTLKTSTTLKTNNNGIASKYLRSQKDGLAGKGLAIKPGDMNSFVRAHIMKGENQFPQAVP